MVFEHNADQPATRPAGHRKRRRQIQNLPGDGGDSKAHQAISSGHNVAIGYGPGKANPRNCVSAAGTLCAWLDDGSDR